MRIWRKDARRRRHVGVQDNIREFALQWWNLCRLPGQQMLSISKSLCSYHLPWACFCARLARLMQPVQLHSLHCGRNLSQTSEATYVNDIALPVLNKSLC